MRKLARTQMRAWAQAHLNGKQGGLCPLCKRPINMSVQGAKSDYVIDHDHTTGEIRGVLHRGCNGAEGKVANAAGRWAGLGMDIPAIAAWLANLVDYYAQPGTGLMYPTHKTPEEKAEAAKAKRRVAAATRRATAKVKAMTTKDSQ